MATTMKRPENRLELLELLGVPIVPDPAGVRQPKRNEDKSYPMPVDCPTCGATRFQMEYDKPSGIDGTVCHVNADGDGCRIRTDEAIALVGVEITEAPKPAPTPKVVVAVARTEPTDPNLDYIRFREPVTCGKHGDLQSWSRTKHLHIGARVEGPFVVLSFGNERRRVPIHNVAYIADRVAHVHNVAYIADRVA